jgi:UDP-glucose 4-epimerase
MNIIVTGGCGFIGSNLVDELILQKHNVTVIDNLTSDAHDQFYFNKEATYYHYSITEDHLVSQCFEHHKPDYVFHLAAEARIQNCITNPSKALETNTAGTQVILSNAKLHGAKRVMFSSTSAIYGLNETLPQVETLPPNCLNMYSYSKLFSEGLCKLYSDLYGLDTACFRYFNVYGHRQPVRGPYAPVIGVFSRQKKAGESMTVVGDGLQTRDYVHVSDIVSANIAAMNCEQKINGEIINIGSGRSFSVLDIAKMMKGVYNHISPRQGEAKHTLSDYTKATTLLNWKPQYSLETYMENHEYDN